MADKKVDWRYALDMKAVALRSLQSKPFIRSLILKSVNKDNAPYVTWEEVQKHTTKETYKEVLVAQELTRKNIMRAEPIIISTEIYNYVESMLIGAKTLTGFVHTVDEDHIETDYEIREDMLVNTPPILHDELIPSGFVVFDGFLELGSGPNAINIVALNYSEFTFIETGKQGMFVMLFLDPASSGYTAPDYYGYFAVVGGPVWLYNTTFESYLSKIQSHEILGHYRYVKRIPNLMLFNWAYGFTYCLLKYLRERTHVTREPDNKKKVAIYARKLNLEPRVQIVIWRKEADNKTKDPDHVPAEREWSCRWFVKEHKRTYNRGKANERTITIKSYVKGPEGKPLKAPNITINAAVR